MVIGHQLEALRQFKATFLVEGMTCSSCVGTITTALKEKVWVRSADISLINHNAEVVFEGDESESRVKELIDAIEDAGYSTSLDQLQPRTVDHSLSTDANPDLPAARAWATSLALSRSCLS